jgi:hypothetical protein
VPRSQVTGHTLGTRALFAGGRSGPLPLFPSDRVDIFESLGRP